jgi:hypothetical protein
MPAQSLRVLATRCVQWHSVTSKTSIPRRIRAIKLAHQLSQSFLRVGDGLTFNVKDVQEESDFVRINYTSESTLVLGKNSLVAIYPKRAKAGWRCYLTHIDIRGRLGSPIFDGRVSKTGQVVSITIHF